MNLRRFLYVATLVWASHTLIPAATPVIQSISVPQSARVMDSATMSVNANAGGDPRALRYQWSIAKSATGKETIRESSQARAYLEIWWAAAGSELGVGNTVRVRVQVSYADPLPDDQPAVAEADIHLSSLNRPPVPRITGTLGSPTARVKSGQAVNLIDDTTDPDRDPVTPSWSLGKSMGGSYRSGVVLIGSHGFICSFTVPPITGWIDQPVILMVEEGLHKVTAQAIAYLEGVPDPPPPPPSSGISLSLQPSSQVVQPGATAPFKATTSGASGQATTFVWTFEGNTVSTPAPVQVNSSEWESTLNVATTGLQARDYQVGVRAFQDGAGGLTYSNALQGRLTVQQNNQSPTARIRHDHDGNQQFDLAGSAFVKTSLRNVALHGRESTDDGGAANLSYQWTVVKGAGAQVSPAAGSDTVLSVADGFEGEVEVKLTVQDAGGLTSSATGKFVFEIPNDPPVPVMQLREGEGDWRVVAPETTVEVGSRSVELDASLTTDDGGPEQLNYAWSASVSSFLSSRSGPRITLSLPLSGTVKVSLKATDAKGSAKSIWANFKFVPVNSAPVARVKFDDDGDGFFSGPFDDGHVAQSASRTVALSGEPSTDDGPAGDLSFAWAVSGLTGAELSSTNTRDTTLTVPQGGEGTATVTLTVTDQPGLASSVTVKFAFTAADSDQLSAQILAAPDAVEVGAEILVEGGVDGEFDPATGVCEWRAFDGKGNPLDVYSRGSRARLVAPDLDGENPHVRIEFRVRQGQSVSEWAVAEVPLVGPKLYFSQLGVGRIPGTNLQFETVVVLVNGSDRAAQVQAVLANNSAGPNWRLRIDGEPRSDLAFEISPGGARKFLVSDSEVGFGWMMVSSNVKLAGYLFYRVMETGTGRVVREVPILPVQGRSFRTALDPGQNSDLALALVNVTDQPVRFRLVVNAHTGTSMETMEMELAPGEHTAKFLAEIFDGSQYSEGTIPQGFPGGTLQILTEGDSGRLVATIIRTEGGLPQTILPVVAQD